MKKKILELLQNCPDFISGQELSERFGVSRTAVWKVIRQLEAEGYVIQAVRNKGYRLTAQPDLLTEETIQNQIHTEWAGQQLVVFSETDSTNDQAKKLAEEGAGQGLLVVSDSQTAGKGRRGRSWESRMGEGIFMTLLLKPDIAPGNASMLTLVMALAVRAGIRQVTGIDTQIKWPNDIVCDGKKVCGILTEMSAQIDYINYIVVGVGINVSNEVFPEEVASTATSLYLLTGVTCSRAKLISEIMAQFEIYYAQYLQTQDLSGLMNEYNSHLVNRGRSVRVLNPKREYTGVAHGINQAGELLVQTEDGIMHVSSGEVSVRGVYGIPLDMNQEEVVLCGSSAYTKKYYLNPDFQKIPQGIQDELKLMCVLYTEDVGGTLTLKFDEDGDLVFETAADEGDLLYDEIGSVLKMKQLQNTKQELLESLEMYYKVMHQLDA